MLIADVTCDEVCVYCGKHFTKLSAFRRHAESHTNGTDRKAKYMQDTCDELGRSAENELHRLAQGRGLLLKGDDESRDRKRDWDAAGLDPETGHLRAKKSKGLVGSDSHHINGTVPSSPSIRSLTITKVELHQFPYNQLPHTCRFPIWQNSRQVRP